MSDTPQDSSWWQASDGKWYPPERHPDATAAQPAAPSAGGPPPFTGATPQAGAPQSAGVPPTSGQVPAQPGVTPPQSDEPEGADSGGRGRLIAIVVIIVLLLGGGVAAFLVLGGGDDTSGDSEDSNGGEADKDIGAATAQKVDDGPIEFDQQYEDTLEETRTEGRYSLEAPAGAIMTLTVENDGTSNRGVFTTFESDGQRFAAFRVAPGASESQTIVLGEEGAADFELVFTEGPAAFTFEVALETQDDAGGGGDAGGDFESAFALDAGQSVSAQLGGEDKTDHYTLELQPGTEFVFDASADRASERGVFFTIELDGDRLFAERVQPGADTKLVLLLGDQDEGTLEIIATEGPATYGFTADFTDLSEGGEDGDAPAELADARSIDPTATLEGKVGDRDEADYFVFTAPSATLTLTGTATAESERGYLVTVEDESGSRVGAFRVQPGSEQTETFEVTAGAQLRMIVGEGPATHSIGIG